MHKPDHIGIIPDGNRRWAENNGLSREKGYKSGLQPGIKLYELCKREGINEITYYGFTMDNTKRPSTQTKAFRKACINAVKMLSNKDAYLLVVGNTETKMFPNELKQYTEDRIKFGKGNIKVNFLVNYGWHWDLRNLFNKNENYRSKKKVHNSLKSKKISRVDLIIRWGARKRLSGFLPVQSIYADIYTVDDLWPEFKEEHFYNALEWYNNQDITYGG